LLVGGYGIKEYKYISIIAKQILWESRPAVNVIGDKFETPTYTRDFARGIRIILESVPLGFYNQVYGGKASRYDIVSVIAEVLNLGSVIAPVKSFYFQERHFSNSPKSEQLVNFKLTNLGWIVMRDWEVSLCVYLPSLIRELELHK
jgi:dTDP-4-dehydrorhamnose reductase